ncbi:MAG: bifunctional hydroxymethylpyrimidine kinase/phosphomethylpyrimidine kinase, partial [Leptospira sp.]|nr:bifunctional hydroxymethylpyrimidine kinase/phosphomethylpyrimidine kinase [Leptospira sp.]
GPGLSENHLSPTIEQILEMPKRFVIDAGGLPVVREKKIINDVLLTPHLGEFSSLTGKKNSSISDAIPDLREYAIAHNVNILLKSHISVFCNTLGHLYFWNFPNTKLAVMGTGDLLAGTLAVFLSKGFSVLDSVHFSLSFLDKSREMKSKYPTAFEIKIFLEESLKYV